MVGDYCQLMDYMMELWGNYQVWHPGEAENHLLQGPLWRSPIYSASGAVESENVGSCRACNTKLTMVARQTISNPARTEQEPKTAESVPLWTYGTFGKFWIAEGPFFQGTEALMRFTVRSGSWPVWPGKKGALGWDNLGQVMTGLSLVAVVILWCEMVQNWFVDVFFSGVGCCLV